MVFSTGIHPDRTPAPTDARMSTVNYRKRTCGYDLDRDQGRCRIGLLALTNDHVIERDMMSMRPNDDQVHIFVARVPFAGHVNHDNLRAMAGHITEATNSIIPGKRLDSVIYGCTSGTAAIGYQEVAQAVAAGRPGAFCVTPVTAAHAAFAALGLRSIAVLAPYTDAVTRTTVEALTAGGIDVVKVTNFDILASDDISAVTPKSIVDGASLADDPTADGLFICCTDFRATQVIGEIENKIDKPVVTSNQAAFWQAIRRGGYAEPLSGHGRLLLLRP